MSNTAINSIVVSIDSQQAVSATYNSTTSAYEAVISTPSEGTYNLTVNISTEAGSFVFVTEVFSLVPITDFELTTDYGAADEETALNVTDLSFEEATTSGFELNFGLAGGSNVTAIIDWGDGASYVVSLPAGVVTYVYQTGGSYTINATATSPLGYVLKAFSTSYDKYWLK